MIGSCLVVARQRHHHFSPGRLRTGYRVRTMPCRSSVAPLKTHQESRNHTLIPLHLCSGRFHTLGRSNRFVRLLRFDQPNAVVECHRHRVLISRVRGLGEEVSDRGFDRTLHGLLLSSEGLQNRVGAVDAGVVSASERSIVSAVKSTLKQR